MTEYEYNDLQKRFKSKITLYPTSKEEARNEGIRSCMSILHEVYERQKQNSDRGEACKGK